MGKAANHYRKHWARRHRHKMLSNLHILVLQTYTYNFCNFEDYHHSGRIISSSIMSLSRLVVFTRWRYQYFTAFSGRWFWFWSNLCQNLMTWAGLPLCLSGADHWATVHIACVTVRSWRSGVQILGPAASWIICIFRHQYLWQA